MAQQESKQMIVGLDIGTSKVVAVVGEIDPDGVWRSWVSAPTHQRHEEGVVVNIESTVNAIQRAVEEAELMADVRFTPFTWVLLAVIFAR